MVKKLCVYQWISWASLVDIKIAERKKQHRDEQLQTTGFQCTFLPLLQQVNNVFYLVETNITIITLDLKIFNWYIQCDNEEIEWFFLKKWTAKGELLLLRTQLYVFSVPCKFYLCVIYFMQVT